MTARRIAWLLWALLLTFVAGGAAVWWAWVGVWVPVLDAAER